jgi:hypothetical protein
MTFKPIIGAGFFAVMNSLLSYLIQCNYNNKYDYEIDFDDEMFPYNNNSNTYKEKNIFNKYFNIIAEKNKELLLNVNKLFHKYYEISLTNFSILNVDIIQKYDPTVKDYNNILYREYLIKLNNSDNEIVLSKRYHYKYLHFIFSNMLEINKDILDKVNTFYNIYMKDYLIIGVHSRTSVQKLCEKGNKNDITTTTISNIKKYVNNTNITNYKIYLASDTHEIIEKFQNEFGDRLLYNTDNIYIANTKYDNEPHFGFKLIDNQNNSEFLKYYYKNKPGINGGIQLLIDVLLLSKCNLFISSESNLSQWVFIFNPEINEI